MDWDEATRSKPAPQKDLSVLSIGELRDYISFLKAEMERAEAAISAKGAHSTAANTIFGNKILS